MKIKTIVRTQLAAIIGALICIASSVSAQFNFKTRLARQSEEKSPLGLPAGASSIRGNIVDSFSCKGKLYGYYADVANDCQIFHVCLSATFPSGEDKMYKWSFICPDQTIFNQEKFTCTRVEDSIPCKDAPSFYSLNMELGKVPEKRAKRRSTPFRF